MVDTLAEKKVCPKCGVEVRDGTAFCFACGGRISSDEAQQETNGSATVRAAESRAALDDLAQKLKNEQPRDAPENKLAKAAEERKKARVTQRKSREFVWEPQDDTPVALFISVGVVLIVAVLVVLITVIWK